MIKLPVCSMAATLGRGQGWNQPVSGATVGVQGQAGKQQQELKAVATEITAELSAHGVVARSQGCHGSGPVVVVQQC